MKYAMCADVLVKVGGVAGVIVPHVVVSGEGGRGL